MDVRADLVVAVHEDLVAVWLLGKPIVPLCDLPAVTKTGKVASANQHVTIWEVYRVNPQGVGERNYFHFGVCRGVTPVVSTLHKCKILILVTNCEYEESGRQSRRQTVL